MVTPFSVELMSVAWVPKLDLNRETPVLGIIRRRQPRAHSCGAPGVLLGPRPRTAAGRGPRHASQKADAPGIPAGLGGTQPPSGRNTQTPRPPAARLAWNTPQGTGARGRRQAARTNAGGAPRGRGRALFTCCQDTGAWRPAVGPSVRCPLPVVPR